MADLFTLKYYEDLLETLKEENYEFCFFADKEKVEDVNLKTVILRHDIDFDVIKAKDMVDVEIKCQVKSVYFFLLTSPFYNIYEPETRDMIQYIIDNGFDVGIHFDESIYEYENTEELNELIKKEIEIFERTFNIKTTIVSFHRPIKEIHQYKIKIDYLHTYDEQFIKKMKYASDSKKIAHEGDYINLVKNGGYNKLQLLFHPIWWNETLTDTEDDFKDYITRQDKNLRKKISENCSIYI